MIPQNAVLLIGLILAILAVGLVYGARTISRLRGQVASVRVSGRGATVREVQVLLADGDRSTMTIEPVSSGGGSLSRV